jgi:hypothetical protein
MSIYFPDGLSLLPRQIMVRYVNIYCINYLRSVSSNYTLLLHIVINCMFLLNAVLENQSNKVREHSLTTEQDHLVKLMTFK